MPTSEFFDYEPIRRRKPRAPATEELSARVGATKRDFSEPVEQEFGSPRQRESERSKEDSLPRNGHALTFAGLFLFCLVLYVRPYEIFPQAVWLRNIALILAVATLAVYLPTQLGLEGKLTIH